MNDITVHVLYTDLYMYPLLPYEAVALKYCTRDYILCIRVCEIFHLGAFCLQECCFHAVGSSCVGVTGGQVSVRILQLEEGKRSPIIDYSGH